MKHFIFTILFLTLGLFAFSQIQLAKDFAQNPYNYGAKGSNISSLIKMNDIAYFNAYTPETGYELWRSDGTEAGTWLVKDIYPGWRSAQIREKIVYNNRLYFSATSSGYGSELWVSDGTSEGTYMLEDLYRGTKGGAPSSFAISGGILYFSATSGSNLNRELWRSNGTTQGTHRVKDINVGEDGSYPKHLVDVNGTLFFSAKTDLEGRELWKSDGTAVGTQLVKDIYPGSQSGISGGDPLGENPLIAFQNKLIFPAITALSGEEIWSSDGTLAGTGMLKNINFFNSSSEPEDWTIAGNNLYFTASTNSQGRELWVTDGTSVGTVLVEDIEPGATGSSPSSLKAAGSILYFSANTSTNGRELWRSLGTAANTYQVKDIRPGASSSNARPVVSMGGKMYFSANNGLQGTELYSTTGGAHTTSMVKDFYLGASSGARIIGEVVVIQNVMYYPGGNATMGTELLRTDGTLAGTSLVKDICPQHTGGLDDDYYSLTAHGNDVYWVGKVPGYGRELCKSNGTSWGTKVVKDLDQGNGLYYPRNLYSHNTHLFLSGDNGNDGLELWKTTGSSFSTVQVADLNQGQDGSNPHMYCSYQGDLYFIGESSCCGYGLMKYDGTLIVVSHDKTFLDKVCSHTLMIHRQGVKKMRGGVDKIRDQIKYEEIIHEQTRQNFEKKRAKSEKFIREFRSGARSAGLVQSRIKMLEKQKAPGNTYNCADNEPAAQRKVIEYAANLLGIEPPKLIPFAEAELSPMAKSFYSANRRIKNDKIKEILGTLGNSIGINFFVRFCRGTRH